MRWVSLGTVRRRKKFEEIMWKKERRGDGDFDSGSHHETACLISQMCLISHLQDRKL